MSFINHCLNPNAFDEVGTQDYDPTTTTAMQDRKFISPWTASFPEIMEKIFVEVHDALRSEHPRHQSAWLRLTRVCQAWRQLALDTPALWTHLRMYNIAYPGELERLLSRSGDQLVHLELNFVKRRLLSAAEFEACVKFAVWVHGHRITDFDVSCFSADLVPIRKVETILDFPGGVEVFLEPQTSSPGSAVRLRGGGFPRLSQPLQDDEANPEAVRMFRAVGKPQRYNLVEHTFWQAFGLRIPLVLRAFWSLTHLDLEYCGPQDRLGSVMRNVCLPPSLIALTIKDEPWEMQTLLSHISFGGLGAKDSERMCIKLAVDLENSKYSSRFALHDLLHAIQWPSIYFHASVCSAVLLNLSSDYMLTLVGFDWERRPKFQFDFFIGGGDRSAILALAADTLNNYYNIFIPCGEPRDVPWFSEMRQLSIHDASGELGRLLDWSAFVSCLPPTVDFVSLGKGRLVAEFLRAIGWPSEDGAIFQKCRARGILNIGKRQLQIDLDAIDEPGAPNYQLSPPSSPPQASQNFPPRDEGVRLEDSDQCSTFRNPPRPLKKLVQTKNVQADQAGDSRASPPLETVAAMDAWDEFAGVWEDHIWNMAAVYNDTDWMHMSA